jgi:hypothetical protein
VVLTVIMMLWQESVLQTAVAAMRLPLLQTAATVAAVSESLPVDLS